MKSYKDVDFKVIKILILFNKIQHRLKSYMLNKCRQSIICEFQILFGNELLQSHIHAKEKKRHKACKRHKNRHLLELQVPLCRDEHNAVQPAFPNHSAFLSKVGEEALLVGQRIHNISSKTKAENMKLGMHY